MYKKDPAQFNMIQFIDDPLTKLDSNSKSILENIINEAIRDRNFTNKELHILRASYYAHINHSTRTEFIIDLEDAWKLCGFTRIDNAKRLLKKFFKEEEEYKILLLTSEEKKRRHGGQNKESTIMTVYAFKRLCLLARTKQAIEFHEYFIKMEEIMLDSIKKANESLNVKLLECVQESEKAILSVSAETPLVYIGQIEDNLVKFGQTKDISKRIKAHKREFPSFVLKYTVHSDNYIALEDEIKSCCQKEKSILYGRRISKEYGEKNQTELIQLDSEFTIQDLHDEVQRLNQVLIDRKTMGDNYTIMKLREKIENYENRIKRVKRDENNMKRIEIERDHFKQLLDQHNIAYNLQVTEPTKDDFEERAQRYIYEFLRDLYNKNKTRETMTIQNIELYKL